MHRRNVITGTILFLVFVLTIFLSVTLLTGNRLKQETPDMEPGFCDLSDFDFDHNLAYILHSGFLYYPGALYSYEDFAADKASREPVILDGGDSRFDPGDCGTYRIVLLLPEGKSYGLSSFSAMYSQRLFINGTEYPSVGTPRETAEETVPKTTHYTVYFTAETTRTEIVIQFANFNHADYGGVLPVYIGSQENILARDAMAQQRIHLLAGCIFTAFLFFLGMFFFFRKRYALLWFSFSCLMTGLRVLIVDEKAIMLLIPNLPWKLSIGLEYLSLIMLMYSFLLYIFCMFPGIIHKAVLYGFGALCALFAAFVLLTPPIIYTRYILWFEIAAAMIGIYVVAALIYSAIRRKKDRYAEHYLVFVGASLFIIMSIIDIQVHRSGGYSLPLGLAETGILIFIFFNMIALTLQFSRTDMQLDAARRSERETQEKNRLLDEMSQLKSDFLANISHEMRTPLTVMASYAGLTAMQIRQDALDEKTLDNLSVIQREAKRLAEMVEQIKEVSLEKKRQLALSDTDARTLLHEAADFCEPICRKNRNRIIVRTEPIALRVNTGSIFQTLINLIVNANRHTKNGTISLSAEYADGVATVTVHDDGEGIPSDMLAHLFERGISADDGTGLGLPICKEIIVSHGGKISVESELGTGTSVQFTLPVSGGRINHE